MRCESVGMHFENRESNRLLRNRNIARQLFLKITVDIRYLGLSESLMLGLTGL